MAIIKKLIGKSIIKERRSGVDRRKKHRRSSKPSSGSLPKPHYSRGSRERRKGHRRAS